MIFLHSTFYFSELSRMLLFFSCFSLLTNCQSERPIAAHYILFTDLNYPEDQWEKYVTIDDDHVDKYLKSKSADSFITFRTTGSYFWIECSKDSQFGSVAVYINGIQQDFDGNLVSNIPEDGVVLYHSDVDYGSMEIKFEARTFMPITFSRFVYNYYPPLTSISSNELIRVYYPDCERSDNWHENSLLQYMDTFQKNAYVSSIFNGTKVYIYAQRRPGFGTFDVYIDDKYDRSVDCSFGDIGFWVVYESNDLPFGQHTIEIRHPDEDTILFGCFLYRPHLIFSYSSIRDNMTWDSSWTLQPAKDPNPSYKETNSQGTASVSLQCTRFWLTGIKGPSYYNFTIRISEGNSKIHETSVNTYQSWDLHSVLLYESPVLDLKQYTISIATDGKVAICDFLFSQQPQNAVVIYAKDMKMSGDYEAGRESYKLNKKDSTFTLNYFGSTFYVIGYSDGGSVGSFLIHDNGKQIGDARAYNGFVKIPLALLYQNTGEVQNHQIILTHNDNTGVDKYLLIYYVFYLTYSDRPAEPCSIITPKSFSSKDKYWTEKTPTDSDPYIESSVIGSKATFTYGGSNFTLEGYVGPSSGKAYIYIDHELKADVPLYREQYNYSIFYASPQDIDIGEHEVSIVNSNGNPITLSKVYFKPSPSNFFTASSGFSASKSFTKSTVFSLSDDFTETSRFSHSDSFTNSIVFTTSIDFSESSHFTKSSGFSRSNSFTKSIDFTKSEMFSISNEFSESDGFSKSIEFSSHYFSSSVLFSSSISFTKSLQFTASSYLIVQTGEGKKSNLALIIGVVLGILVLLAIVLLIIFLYIRRRKQQTTGDNNSMWEANGTDVSLGVGSITQNDDLENDANSFDFDLFDGKLNYEEDRKDFEQEI